MSIGFIQSGSSKKAVDVYSSSSGGLVDVSLQNVLSKYDSIRTDFDRLVDNARLNTFDITSKQHYNTYLRESVNGWAETWYSEYRAVLALRADALQKKLSAAYNRVLERSAFAEMKPNEESVFAPYANRTYSLADTTYRTPVAQTLLKDIPPGSLGTTPAIFTAPPTTAPPPGPWEQRIMGTALDGSAAGSEVRPGVDTAIARAQREAVRNALLDVADKNNVTDPDKFEDLVDAAIGFANGVVDPTNGGPPTAAPTPGQTLPTMPPPSPLPPGVADAIKPYSGYMESQSPSSGYINPLDEPQLTSKNAIDGGSSYVGTDPTYDPDGKYVILQGNLAGVSIPKSYPMPALPIPPNPVPVPPIPADNNHTYIYVDKFGTSHIFTPATRQGAGFPQTLAAGTYGMFYDGTGTVTDANNFNMYPVMSYSETPIAAAGIASSGNPSPPADVGGVGDPDSGPNQQGGSQTSSTGTWYFNDDPFLGISYNYVGSEIDTADGWKNTSSSLYKQVRNNLQQIVNVDPSVVPGASVPTTPAPTTTTTAPTSAPVGGAPVQFASIYGGAPGELKIELPMFGIGGAGSTPISIDLSAAVPSDVYDTLLNNQEAAAALDKALEDINKMFVGRQYNDIVLGNQYDASYTQVSVMPLVMMFASPITTIIEPMEDVVNKGGVSFAVAGSSSIVGAQYNDYFDFGVGPDIHFGHLSAIGEDNNLRLPTLGLAGFGFAVPIPIPYVGQIWIGAQVNVSYDLINQFVTDYLKAIKENVVETIQTQAYAASSGTAFDSYASRAEYHFSEDGLFDATDNLNLNIFGIEIPVGDMARDLSIDVNGDINHASNEERLMEYKHSMQGAETRETETGAFFATSAFLSQFELDNMEYEYWTGTQQNEEVINADLVRSMSTAGKELIHLAMSSLIAASGSGGGLIGGAISFLLGTMVEQEAEQMFYDLIYKDRNNKGQLLNGFGSTSKFRSEAYDYIESDHKPFEGDSDFNYPPGGPFDFMQDIFGAEKPDFIMEGYASSRRYRPKTSTSGGFAEDITLSDYSNYANNDASAWGVGPRGQAGRESSPDTLNVEVVDQDNSNETGIWNDTPLGDINEVYVGSRKVSFSNLNAGFGEFTYSDISSDFVTDTGSGAQASTVNSALGANRTVETEVKRYIGASSRAYQRRYDGADPISFDSFTTGLYSDRYTNGMRGYYDRKNQYSMNFKSSYDSSNVSLFGAQALNPTLGGFVKMAEIQKNKHDDVLQIHDSSGMAGVRGMGSSANALENQQFGAAADGTLNEVNKILYEHLHLREDGRNLSTIREYRDVFDSGLMKNVFLSGQTYHPSGGGITSSIEIRYDAFGGRANVQDTTRDNFDFQNLDVDVYGRKGKKTSNGADGTAGTADDGFIYYDPYNSTTLNKTSGKANVYLNSYFAYKKRSGK